MPQAPRVGIATGPHLTPSATVSPDLGTPEGGATLIAEVPEVDVLVSARIVSLADGVARDVAPADLALGFRTSSVGPRDVVVAATFQGAADDPTVGAARIDEIVRWRREHQPGGQNAGSIFKNPRGDAAGRLVEAAGGKGLRVGGAVVSEKHANFFVAEPGASAEDVHALILEVRRRVAERTGVELEPEVRLVGFAGEAPS